MDYGLPRADTLPFFGIATCNFPSTTNPTGLKGAGSVAASPAIIDAVSDAIWRAYGVHDIDMPTTPFAEFKAIRDASGRSLA